MAARQTETVTDIIHERTGVGEWENVHSRLGLRERKIKF